MKRLLTLLFTAIFLTSCYPPLLQPRLLSWSYADVRILQQPTGQDNSLQLVALYTRLVKSELQIRLDLLDFETGDPLDLYLAIDSSPGGKRDLPFNAQADLDWDTLIHLPANGSIQAIDTKSAPVNDLKLRVQRDPTYDDIIISLDSSRLPNGLAGLSLQAFAVRSGIGQLASSIGPVQADAAPPHTANLLLAFWDTFPAVTPAQALRRWDGAHTGPFNGRHGLRHLLGASATYHIPIFLLDLKSASNLSSLDTVGGLPVIQSLVQQGILNLPDVQSLSSGPPGSPLVLDGQSVIRSKGESQKAAETYGLQTSQALFSPVFLPKLEDGHTLLFIQEPKTGQADPPGGRISACQRWQNQRVVSLPSTPEVIKPEDQQATQNGLAVGVRRSLLGVAANQQEANSSFLLLGGDLTQSAWGDPSASRPAMDYIANHPWIHVMRLDDLLTCESPSAYQPETSETPAPQITGISDHSSGLTKLTVSQEQAKIVADLSQATPGLLTDTAWRAYRSLLAPGLPDIPELWNLRRGYFAPVGYLLAAGRWENSLPLSNTAQMQRADVDWDGEDEIILSSSSFFLVIEQKGGYLAAAFYRDRDGPHQIIGPSAQYYVGISDPTLWKPELGPAGDPEQLRGAFSEIPVGYISPSWEPFSVLWQSGTMTLQSPDGKVTKTIRVGSKDIQVDYRSADAIEIQIPLVLDPWVSNLPGWEKRYESTMRLPNWTWGLAGGIKVEISTNAELDPRAFSDTRQELLSPENPNFNFPPGHYLPFPMALGLIQGEGDFEISVRIVQ